MGNQINIQNNANLRLDGDLVGGDKVSVGGDLIHGHKTTLPLQFQNAAEQKQCLDQLEQLRQLVLTLCHELEEEDKDDLADEATSQSREVKKSQELVKNLQPGKPADQKQSRSFGDYIKSVGHFLDKTQQLTEKTEKLANKVIPLIAKAKSLITSIGEQIGV